MSASKPPKFRILENVVAAIERSLTDVEDAKITPNASVPELVSGVMRQVDVLVEIPSGARILRIGVEVKDEASPIDLPEMEQLICKLQKIDTDRGCVVSKAGFTKNARDEAVRHGVEICTVQEIQHPHWWLASTMQVKLRQTELLGYKLNFLKEERAHVAELLADMKGTDFELALPSGETLTLNAFVSTHGIKASKLPDFDRLKDGDLFILNIDFSNLKKTALKYRGEQIPVPQDIDAHYRLRIQDEEMKLSAYERQGGVLAFTGIPSNWDKQLTIVVTPHEDEKSISFAIDDCNPKKKAVPRRSGTEE